MPRRHRLPALLLLAMVAACAAPQGAGGPTTAAELQEFGLPEQSTLRTANHSGPTPTTIPGARRVTTAEVAAMLRAGPPPPVLIDVATGGGHPTIPGAIWLPRGGLGTGFEDEVQRGLVATAERLAGGDRGRAIVTFCPNQNCWLSYNAALRLVRAGFTNVHWYRGGYQAWAAAGQPTMPSSATGW